MNEKQEYITDEEISELEDFLLERFDDEEDHPDKDEGILDLSELDGYFAAIVSAPHLIPPSDPCSCGSGKKFKKCCLH